MAKDKRKRPKDRAAEQRPIKSGMTHREIEDAGGMVDLPYEAPPGKPERLEYADLGPEKESWQPPQGYTIAGVPYADVVAGVGSGAAPPATASSGDGDQEA